MKEYLIDTHAHIDMLEAPIESTLQLMKDFGVKKAVIPSVEVSSMEKVIAAAEAAFIHLRQKLILKKSKTE